MTFPEPDAAAEVRRLRERVQDWRERAVMTWTASPEHWMALMGVPLATYLAKLDELDAAIPRHLATLTTGGDDVG